MGNKKEMSKNETTTSHMLQELILEQCVFEFHQKKYDTLCKLLINVDIDVLWEIIKESK